MITFTSYSVKEQDPPVYYSIVILTILYYLRVADLMGITSPYPRENIGGGRPDCGRRHPRAD